MEATRREIASDERAEYWRDTLLTAQKNNESLLDSLSEIRRLAKIYASGMPCPVGKSDEYAQGWYQSQKQYIETMKRILDNCGEPNGE